MKFSRPDADVFVPDSRWPAADALARVTHLCIGAHQDDIEIMAHAGIADCLEQPGEAFGGVVVTNGAGSPRTGSYAQLTDAEMQAVRREEQRKAAQLGRYSIQLQLAHPSSDVKQRVHPGVKADLAQIFAGCRPDVVYLHNPADKHDTHVAVLLRCLEAIRALPAARRPARVLGCEVWRDLDWLVDAEKVALDAGRHLELAAELLKVFDSQISGGKRYDLGIARTTAANATFHTSARHRSAWRASPGQSISPASVNDPGASVEAFVAGQIAKLQADVLQRVRAFA